MSSKEVKELVDDIRGQTYKGESFDVVEDGGGHLKVVWQEQTVMYEDDAGQRHPLTLPSTPSDSRWRENTMKKLIKAGVFPDDPRKAGQRGLTDEQREEREQKREEREEQRVDREGVIEANKRRSAERQANTTVVRDRAERLFDKIGVWKPAGSGHSGWRGTVAEVARVAFRWAEDESFEPRSASENGAKITFRKLYVGDSIADEQLSFVRGFIDHLEKAPNPTRLYTEILRRELGITDQREPVPTSVPGAELELREGAELEPVPVQDERLEVDESKLPLAQLGKEQRSTVKVQMEELERRATEAETQAEKLLVAVADAEARLVEAQNASAQYQEDARRLQEIRNGRLPSLALDALGEMIGTPVIGKDEDLDDDLFDRLEAKRERSVELAKQILALELGAAS